MLVDLINSAACIVLLCYLMPVALIMDVRKFWVHRVAMWMVTVALGINAMTPFATFLPPVLWTSMVLHVALTLAVTIYRREIWFFLTLKLKPPRRPTQRSLF